MVTTSSNVVWWLRRLVATSRKNATEVGHRFAVFIDGARTFRHRKCKPAAHIRRALIPISGEHSLMSQLLTDPDHWRLRAQEARRSAQQLEDPEAKAAKLGMADKYDRLAARAAEWTRKTEDIPQFLKSGPTMPP
jgi:hypothetical protein